MKEVDDTQPDKCECGSYLFKTIYAVAPAKKFPGQYGLDHGNKHRAIVAYECDECGKRQKVRPEPES